MTSKHRIAIIEDNKVIRGTVSTYVGMHDEFDFNATFTSVEDFLNRMEKERSYSTDIMLLDVGLPGMSGIEGIPHILKAIPNVDIIMLTTYEEEPIILKALCSGACSYISKKTSLEDIVAALLIVKKGGSYMSPSIAREIVQYLMSGQVSKATILSDRQKDILIKLTDGKSYGEIARGLDISIETVRSHVKKMYRTLHVNNKAEAISLYLKGQIK